MIGLNSNERCRRRHDSCHGLAGRFHRSELDRQALQIQARTGGAVADILKTLAEFMREREEVRREIKVLTVDGRISAVFLLGICPKVLICWP
ncbi:MAG: type II secretion system F family protein [Euzebya sp.]